MDTLPLEMIVKISKHLTPQDLACCCAVSRSWRETFNHDIMWKLYCDQELEEPVRKTECLCTVEPAFVTPEAEDTTLTPIGQWRLAYMREKHIFKNWGKHMSTNSESSTVLSKAFPFAERFCELSNFLTDSIFFFWCSNSIEVWDIRSNPPVLITTTDPSINVKMWYSCYPVGGNTIVLKYKSSVQVLFLDIINKCIIFKYEITLFGQGDYFTVHQHYSGDQIISFGVTVCDSGKKLKIYDLVEGMIIKEEQCPVETCRIKTISSSFFSECIIALCETQDMSGRTYSVTLYSTKLLRYLEGSVFTGFMFHCQISKHFVSVIDSEGLKIIDFLTLKVILKMDFKESKIVPFAYRDSFVIYSIKAGKCVIQMFSLTNKSISTVCDYLPFSDTINNDRWFLSLLSNRLFVLNDEGCDGFGSTVAVFKPSGKSLILFDWYPLKLPIQFNKSFTRSFDINRKGDLVIYYHW